ncbi:MAG: site-2 protease family protein [Candidatus Brocadiae bacterium]|nr:site-2 protease family protein [Candidatus Brocadiia bacterium]
MWSFYLGRFWNIHVRVHFSFIAFLILIGLAESIRSNILAGILSCVFLVLVFLFVFFHELAHSLVAKHYGIHVDSITLWPLGGIANMESLPEDPILEIKISAAGPLMNFAFALLLLPLAFISNIFNQSSSPGIWKEISIFFIWLLEINLMLMLFNLIPAFPMDGGRIYRAWKALKEGYFQATQKAVKLSNFMSLLMVCFGIVFLQIGFILIGIFIYIAAKEEMSMVESQYYTNSHREPMYFFYYNPGTGNVQYHFSTQNFQKDFVRLQEFFQGFFSHRR